MTEFAFITTCKGRLHHLQQTLPLLAAQQDSEVIVVDYGCPQKTGNWVEAHYPAVKVVRVTDDEGFSLARARNAGARASSAPWLIFIDADMRLEGGLLTWLRTRLEPGKYFQAGITTTLDIFGTVVCHRSDFNRVEGYDEILRGWGMEDNDFYRRLRENGCRKEVFPGEFLSPIPHGEEERTQFSPYRNRWVSHTIAALYLQMKYDIASLTVSKPDKERREKLYAHARQNVLRIVNQGENADPRVLLFLGDHAGVPAVHPIWGIDRVLVYTLDPINPRMDA